MIWGIVMGVLCAVSLAGTIFENLFVSRMAMSAVFLTLAWFLLMEMNNLFGACAGLVAMTVSIVCVWGIDEFTD